jgi:hypothetical protein
VYLAVPSQPDCPTAWLRAVQAVEDQPGKEAHNVILDVADPLAHTDAAHPIVANVDRFLRAREKSVDTIANTIFPQALYLRHGNPKFIEIFHKRVLPKVRSSARWSGYYFERMTHLETRNGARPLNQLSTLIDRLRDPGQRALNKYELLLFDPERDIDNSPYGRQCLSFLSFHLSPGTRRTLRLTALYRNHYYIEKLLGNLIGLGRLMQFVTRETQTQMGALTVISTHAQIDQPQATRTELAALIRACSLAAEPVASSV